MRNGNTVFPAPISFEARVLILPMRNGNYNKNLSDNLSELECSYPTYEEWKQKLSDKYIFFDLYVLILPMRNGNAFYEYFLLLLLIVLILPMRNGNICLFAFRHSCICMFLSYLWGMETCLLFLFSKGGISSYPTYEEWKLCWVSCFVDFDK